jgi:hypothetical protein
VAAPQIGAKVLLQKSFIRLLTQCATARADAICMT